MTPDSFAGQHGPNAKVSLGELSEELAQIREQGWSMQDEELATGCARSPRPAPVRTVASSPGSTLPSRPRDWSTARIVRELKPALLHACEEISALMQPAA